MPRSAGPKLQQPHCRSAASCAKREVGQAPHTGCTGAPVADDLIQIGEQWGVLLPRRDQGQHLGRHRWGVGGGGGWAWVAARRRGPGSAPGALRHCSSACQLRWARRGRQPCAASAPAASPHCPSPFQRCAPLPRPLPRLGLPAGQRAWTAPCCQAPEGGAPRHWEGAWGGAWCRAAVGCLGRSSPGEGRAGRGAGADDGSPAQHARAGRGAAARAGGGLGWG